MIDVYEALEMYLLTDKELGYVSGGMPTEAPSIEAEVEAESVIQNPCDDCEFPYGSKICKKYCDYY